MTNRWSAVSKAPTLPVNGVSATGLSAEDLSTLGRWVEVTRVGSLADLGPGRPRQYRSSAASWPGRTNASSTQRIVRSHAARPPSSRDGVCETAP